MKFNNKNIFIGDNVEIGKNVKIGDNTIIYDNVIIGNNTIICNNCILGEPENSYYHDSSYENPTLYIGSDCLIRSHAIIYSGSKLGNNLLTGHHITIREKSQIGDHCMIGSYCDIQGDCSLGNYVRLHSFVNIGQKSILSDFVFIYPYVVLTNDPMPPSNTLIGATLGKYSQICAGAIILPGAIIGENSLVGANSTVSGVFDEYSFINGTPAKRICDIRKAPFFDIKTGKKHYPWQYNFDRNMPWENIGFDNWETIERNKLND